MPTRRILPKPDPSLLILSSLAGGERHGYSLMKDVEEFAGVSMGPGTVFGCLARLEERGLVEALEPQDRRHPYRITAAGSAALEEQLRELAARDINGLCPTRRRETCLVGRPGGGTGMIKPASTGDLALPAVARLAIGAYPAWWRERYGADQEMFLADLAADGRPLRWAVVDLALGAAVSPP